MITNTTPLTPNVRKLLLERASQLMVDRAKTKYGAAGVGEVAATLAQDKGQALKASMGEAFLWVQQALELLRNSPGSEEWPDDEAMAGEILRRAHLRRANK